MIMLHCIPKRYSHLQRLHLKYNQLDTFPKECVKKLVNLVELDLEGNRLTSVPGEIGGLTKLERLYLSRNRLNSLPKEIGKLVHVEEVQSVTFYAQLILMLPSNSSTWMTMIYPKLTQL